MTEKTVAIVQARMGSSRLPGKVLMDLGGKSVLARVVRRAGRAHLVDEVVVATTTEPGDEAIVAECARLQVPVTRGSGEDVLSRYYEAAMRHEAKIVVRITSDNPLVDPELTDEVLQFFLDGRYDYVINGKPNMPYGLAVEVMTFEALAVAAREATERYQREHVTPYLYQNSNRFAIGNFELKTDSPRWRWTVDTAQDLELVRAIYERLGNRDTFSWREALAVMEREPELAEINREIQQKRLEQS